MMIAHVYILRSKSSGHYYVGSTIAPDRRLFQHNAGLVASTHNKGPWARVTLLSFASPVLARKAETWIKRLKSREKLERIISGDFVWPSGMTPNSSG